MIYTTAKVTIKNYIATLDRQIVLYRGDSNVEIQFEIVESLYRQYKLDGPNTIENLGASHGQLVIMTPYGSPIFSDITPTKDGKIIFTIPPELMDETSEVGYYTFQIRLFDESQTSRVTLPPINEGIVIEEPIAHEDNI